MRSYWMIGLLAVTLVLTGCGPRQSADSPLVEQTVVNNFFEITPTASGQKGDDSQPQSKAVVAQSTLPAYPTPLPTYLVPSRLVTQGAVTAIPTHTNTVAPTATSQVTSQPTNTSATQTPTTAPTATVVRTATTAATALPTAAAFIYEPQSGTPIQIQNFSNPTAGCNWQAIAGQVFDKDGNPVLNVVVKAGGVWNNTTVNLLGMTGAANQYGEGGYELVLGNKAVATTKTTWVQLFDLASKPLSDKIFVSTSADCTKNLVVLNFKVIGEGFNSYVPMILP